MFKDLGRIVYRVSDMEKAKQWYGQVLDAEPIFDSPVAVAFLVGTCNLVLAPDGGAQYGEGGAVVYWTVDDAVTSYRRLCELGAVPHTDIGSRFGKRSGTVKDPFGNVIGILSDVDSAEKTVEKKPSDTAHGVASLRFLATLDEREEIRGRDHLAEIFITEEAKTALRDPAKKEWFLTKFFPPGIYYGLIARTAYFDSIVEEALSAHIPQIVFLGAGYDSRSYRFADLIGDSRIFEVDAPFTQEHKRSLLSQADIAIPERLTFVPIDFARDDLKRALFGTGFDKDQETLYIWEGVTYYLPAPAIDGTFGFIRKNSPPGSVVCFDYMSTFPGMKEAHGVKEHREFMKNHSPGEHMAFGIGSGRIGSFLRERGFTVTDHLTPEDIGRRYLTLRDGSSAGKANASICYARAAVV
jgi:methyltransferase (TIGR00027 family)